MLQIPRISAAQLTRLDEYLKKIKTEIKNSVSDYLISILSIVAVNIPI